VSFLVLRTGRDIGSTPAVLNRTADPGEMVNVAGERDKSRRPVGGPRSEGPLLWVSSGPSAIVPVRCWPNWETVLGLEEQVGLMRQSLIALHHRSLIVRLQPSGSSGKRPHPCADNVRPEIIGL
jgi:hypothetical protein